MKCSLSTAPKAKRQLANKWDFLANTNDQNSPNVYFSCFTEIWVWQGKDHKSIPYLFTWLPYSVGSGKISRPAALPEANFAGSWMRQEKVERGGESSLTPAPVKAKYEVLFHFVLTPPLSSKDNFSSPFFQCSVLNPRIFACYTSTLPEICIAISILPLEQLQPKQKQQS